MLDKVITFGGYSPRVPTYVPELNLNQVFNFSYYADTFMLDSDDPSVSSWKQVVTRGFPIYRAQGQLFVDETTGKTYMFSGYTNSEYVPGKKHLDSRSFPDLWQLKLHMPGGCFEDVDVDDEAKTARAGPYQRCFACGSAGLWKKCGGVFRSSVLREITDVSKQGRVVERCISVALSASRTVGRSTRTITDVRKYSI